MFGSEDHPIGGPTATWGRNPKFNRTETLPVCRRHGRLGANSHFGQTTLPLRHGRQAIAIGLGPVVDPAIQPRSVALVSAIRAPRIVRRWPGHQTRP